MSDKEYIEREAVLALAEDYEEVIDDGADEIFFEYIPVDKVRSIPAADVRPVEWIPVKERLPEAMQKVLVATYHGGVYFGFMEPRGKFVTANNTLADSWCWEPSVTHWMPLPQTPKEE